MTEWADRIHLRRLIAESRILPRAFYARPTVEVARDLVGKILVHGRTAGRIVETEAYLGLDDRAAHAWRGITPRTRVLFGPPGRAYVYFVYGMHECLNLVTEPDGRPCCVLIRALEPLAGIARMKERRPAARTVEDLASGPGKLTAALGITRRLYGADITRGALTVRGLRQEPPLEIETTPRIGIRECADWPLRFVVKKATPGLTSRCLPG
jgi:DNA-3-methyladenine glycosylase